MRPSARDLSIFSAGGIAALLLVLWRGSRRSSSPVERTSAVPSEGSRDGRYRRSRMAIAFAVLLALAATVGCGLLALFVYRSYNQAEPNLSDPVALGGVYLYFDVPGVTAGLDVSVDTDPEDQLSIWVSTSSMKPGKQLTYSVVLTGSAMPSSVYPAGIPREVDKDGCYRVSVSATDPAQPQSKVSCSRSRGAPEAILASRSSEEPVYVIEGHLTPDAKGNARTYISVLNVGGDTTKNGAQSTFALPTVGTTPLTREMMGSFTAIVDGHPNLHPPSLVNQVQYEKLEPSDDLQNVSPEPDSRSPLTWNSDNNIAASGAIIDDVKQRQQDRGVFFSGVLAGVLGGFIPGLLALWFRVFLPPGIRERSTAASDGP
jgi:hypothetical protein